jgi:hypothetical protein
MQTEGIAARKIDPERVGVRNGHVDADPADLNRDVMVSCGADFRGANRHLELRQRQCGTTHIIRPTARNWGSTK